MIIWDLKCILISDLVTKCHELTHALEINELMDYMYLCTEPTKNKSSCADKCNKNKF